MQVVQEYERAVIFRLGRLRAGGAKGPGLFFTMPCIDSYKTVDLRTVSFDVPPQEVCAHNIVHHLHILLLLGAVQGLRHGQCGRCGLLQGQQSHHGKVSLVTQLLLHVCPNVHLLLQATNNIEDYSHSTRLLAATTLRNVLGTR